MIVQVTLKVDHLFLVLPRHPRTFRQDMLYNELKIKSGTLHPGKYVVADAGNIQLIDHPKFWIDASETF